MKLSIYAVAAVVYDSNIEIATEDTLVSTQRFAANHEELFNRRRLEVQKLTLYHLMPPPSVNHGRHVVTKRDKYCVDLGFFCVVEDMVGEKAMAIEEMTEIATRQNKGVDQFQPPPPFPPALLADQVKSEFEPSISARRELGLD